MQAMDTGRALAEAAAARYRQHALEPHVGRLPASPAAPTPGPEESSVWIVWVRGLRRVECVVPEEHFLEGVREHLRKAQEAGWNVLAVVPTAALSAAHRYLRGLPIQIQGFWGEPSSGFEFSPPEIP